MINPKHHNERCDYPASLALRTLINLAALLALAWMLAMAAPIYAQSVVGTITRPGLEPYSVAVYESGNKFFVADNATGNLYMYDGATNAELGFVFIGTSTNAMVVDEASGKLYAATSGAQKIAVVNAATGAFIHYLTGSYANFPRLALDAALGKLYVLALNGLVQVDVATDAVTPIPGFGGGQLEELALNPVTHEVFVSRFIDDQLVIVDGFTLGQTPIAGLSGLGLAVNWVNNKVYISYCANDPMGQPHPCIYNRNTNTSSLAPDPNDATALFYNPTSNRIYTDSEVNGYSSIIEGASDASFNLPMANPTLELGFRNATNHVYYVGKTFIGIMDDATQLLAQIPISNPNGGGTLRQSIAINQSTGRVYVINDSRLNFVTVVQDTELLTRPPLYLGSRGFPSMLHVIDPVTRAVVESWSAASAFQSSRSLTVRPGGGRLYVSGSQIYAGSGRHTFLTSFATGGTNPLASAFTPDGSRLYVTNNGSASVGVINAATNAVITTVPVGNSPWGIAIKPDGLKAYVANNGSHTVSVINTSSNTAGSPISVGANPYGVAVTPSGTKAYVANSGSATVSVIDTDSDTVVATVPVGTTPQWLAITPDGKSVYVANRGSANVSVISTGTDAVIQTVNVGANPEGIAANPDGGEVYVTNSNLSAASSLSVINTSTFSVTTITLPSNTVESTGLTIADPTSKFAGRVTHGGTPINGANVRAFQSGVLKATATTNETGDYSVFNLKAGTYDIVASAPGYTSQIFSGQTVGTGRVNLLSFNLLAYVAKISNFDGDPKTDIAVYRPSEGNWYIVNTSTGLSTIRQWGAPTDIIAPGDYDGDRKSDIAVYRPSDGNWYVINSSDGSVVIQNWGGGNDRPVPGDYDGDGRTDFAVFRPFEGNWYIRHSSNGTTRVQGWGDSTDKLTPGDYDGDGKADIAVFRPSEGTWYILNSATNTATVRGWGIGGDKPAPGDYDGDGKTDITVFRPADGNWYIINSTTNSATIRNWGNSDDVPVPGDYDGDARTDIAVWRGSEGTWYIIQSSTNTGSIQSLGLVGDVPVPSGYIPQ